MLSYVYSHFQYMYPQDNGTSVDFNCTWLVTNIALQQHLGANDYVSQVCKSSITDKNTYRETVSVFFLYSGYYFMSVGDKLNFLGSTARD